MVRYVGLRDSDNNLDGVYYNFGDSEFAYSYYLNVTEYRVCHQHDVWAPPTELNDKLCFITNDKKFEEISISDLPDMSTIANYVANGKLVTLNYDYVLGQAKDIIGTYEDYCTNRSAYALINYYDFSSSVKRKLGDIKNGKLPYNPGVLYVGIDGKMLYDQSAYSHFGNLYHNEISKLMSVDNLEDVYFTLKVYSLG